MKLRPIKIEEIKQTLNKKVYCQPKYSDDYNEYIFHRYVFGIDPETGKSLLSAELIPLDNSKSLVRVDLRKVLVECEDESLL